MTEFTRCFARRIRNLLAVCFIVFNSLFLFPVAARAEDIAPTVTTIVTQGGDDSSYHIPLTVPVVYDGTTYQDVYATTNSVITFGNPDGTYWTYPQTPSISIESRDWWALPYFNPDMHFIINTSDGGFQVDGAYLPYGTMQGDVTNIVITAQIQTDGSVVYTYSVTGPTYPDDRTGARLVDGTVVTLEQAGVTQVAEPVVLEPTPVEPTPVEPTPVEPSVPEPTPSDPVPPVVPEPSSPTPTPSQPVVDTPVDEPVQVDTPVEQPIETPAPEPTIPPTVDPTPVQETVEPPVDTTVVEETPSEPPVVTLDNGVVLSTNVAQALELFNSPADMVTAIFTNPSQALTAFLNVGADMSPEIRKQSEKVVVAAVIAGQIAQTAAATAAGAAAYRRKP